MKYFSQLQTAVQLVEEYGGERPFAEYMKSFFGRHKKYGSRDRKQIAQLCYAGFRAGNALKQLATEEKLTGGLFLCSQEPNELLQHLRPEWNDHTSLSPYEKCALLPDPCSIPDIFPWKEALSSGIDTDAFCLSFLVQPDLFLRLRPGYEEAVKEKLAKAGIIYREMRAGCLVMSNASKIDQVIELDKEAVIQDYSSQRTGDLLHLPVSDPSGNTQAWDCCAGSGGKSIMVHDLLKNVEITASDIRPYALKNMEHRFAAAGINKYKQLLADLSVTQSGSTPTFFPPGKQFDIIIADVPCTGSGTWSRTPERLAFFESFEIDRFSSLQKKIVGNILPCLKQGGGLLYITCSVFRKENEDVVNYITEHHGLTLHRMELLKGYNDKADTLFAAWLTA